MGVVSLKGTLSGAAGGLEEVGFEGLKEAQVFKGFSTEVAHLSHGSLEGSRVKISKEACGVGHHSKAHSLPVLCVTKGGGEDSINLDCSADSKNCPMEELALFRASFASRGHNFQNPKHSLQVVLQTSIVIAPIAEARHSSTISLSLSSLGIQAASSPSLFWNGLGLEGCEVDSAVD